MFTSAWLNHCGQLFLVLLIPGANALSLVQSQTFSDASAAKQYIKEQGAPVVVKADGLAAGKGVTVAMTLEEAYEIVDSMLIEGAFCSVARRFIVKEFPEGEEEKVSFFAVVDGEHAMLLESAQDHKRVGDSYTGPNTSGIGAYSPAPVLTKELQSLAMESIILFSREVYFSRGMQVRWGFIRSNNDREVWLT